MSIYFTLKIPFFIQNLQRPKYAGLPAEFLPSPQSKIKMNDNPTFPEGYRPFSISLTLFILFFKKYPLSSPQAVSTGVQPNFYSSSGC